MAGDVQIKKELAEFRQMLEESGFSKKGQRPRSKVEEKIKDLDKRLVGVEKMITNLTSGLTALEQYFRELEKTD